MDENQSRVSCKKSTQEAAKDGGDMVECSGKCCKSCTAGMIADCVAICCCPCAVLNFLALAFVIVPWKVGRKCFRRRKSKRRRIKKIKAEREEKLEMKVDDSFVFGIESAFGEEDKMESGDGSARFEAEKVWLELYQVGHLGFGRFSFTGFPSQATGD